MLEGESETEQFLRREKTSWRPACAINLCTAFSPSSCSGFEEEREVNLEEEARSRAALLAFCAALLKNLMKSRRRMKFYLMTLFDTTRRLLRMAPNSESCTARITALCCASITSDMNCRQSFSDGAFLEQFARICFVDF